MLSFASLYGAASAEPALKQAQIKGLLVVQLTDGALAGAASEMNAAVVKGQPHPDRRLQATLSDPSILSGYIQLSQGTPRKTFLNTQMERDINSGIRTLNSERTKVLNDPEAQEELMLESRPPNLLTSSLPSTANTRLPVSMRSLIALFSLLLALPGHADKPLAALLPSLPKGETPVHLFDGKSLHGWDGDAKYWAVANREIIGANTGKIPSSSYLFTKKSSRNFRLLFEVKQTMSPKHSTMHSAVAALGERFEDKGDNKHGFKGPLLMFCHDWGIWDAYGRNRVVPSAHKGPMNKFQHEKKGAWNRIEMLVVGSRIRVVANGSLVFDSTDKPELLRSSPLGLQLHSNSRPQEFRFRGLILTENPADELVTHIQADKKG